MTTGSAHLRPATIDEAVERLRQGHMVILVDDEDRENEGDLVVAAERVTAEAIEFMAEHGRGLICAALAPEIADRLELEPMAPRNEAPLGTAFLTPVDLARLGRPGVGAADRADTIRRLVASDAQPGEFVRPGFVFPLRARPGGVLVRAGQTEGSVDLARLAGLRPAGVICEVMAPDGTMARLPQLLAFGARHDIPVVTVADLIRYRLRRESLVRRVARANLPTAFGSFDLLAYESTVDGATHVVLVHGDVRSDEPVLVRVHRSELLFDVFGPRMAWKPPKLECAMRRIAEQGSGVILYLRSDPLERSDLERQMARYGQPTRGTRPAAPAVIDFRDFGIGAQILADLGVKRLRVLTDQPLKFKALDGFDLEIVEWVSLRQK